jgi:hypothetical protein
VGRTAVFGTALAGKPAIEGRISGSAPDAWKIPGVLGMQNVLNGVSMAVGVMEMALYSSYTRHAVVTISDSPTIMSV